MTRQAPHWCFRRLAPRASHLFPCRCSTDCH